MKTIVAPSITWLALLVLLASPPSAQAFCGFFVAKADAKLFNEASQVVLARDGDRTVITMANDYTGEPDEFAMVIPVPTFIERGQIHIAKPALIEHLDAYSAPRLVEYHDPDPCGLRYPAAARLRMSEQSVMLSKSSREDALGVTVEASYTVGEYDIQILSAKQSGGLVTWLRENGYRIPDGAEQIVGGYLKQGMRFFVAKVNLGEQKRLGVNRLRPIQVAYESAKFMLPIRLGMLNAAGPQELYVYTLTRKGRVETTNYRTVKLPTGDEIPGYVKEEFGDFYRAMFDRQVQKHDMNAVFLEYAWDMAWCDPCAADPLSPAELRELGAFWVDSVRPQSMARDVFLTRLHVRYDAAHFPEDLSFQQTSDRSNFQGRYVLRHAFNGEMTCSAADDYRDSLAVRRDKEARALADLTGWDVSKILARMPPGHAGGPDVQKTRWWERIW